MKEQMDNRHLINALRGLRHEPEFSGFEKTKDARRQALFDRLHIQEEDIAAAYTLRDYFEYVQWRIGQTVLQPAMVGFSSLLIVVGGWMTSVSASEDALPGEFLYGIKIANEQAKLTLASSDERRAELHLEFADRRLEEVTAINASDDEDKAGRVQVAVQSFQHEVDEVQNVMNAMVENGEDATPVAVALENKTNEYATTIDPSVVETVIEDVSQASDAAVDVLVTSVEVLPESPAKEDLQRAFQNDMREIDTRVKLALGRIAVIEEIVATGDATIPEDVDLHAFELDLYATDEQISEAMNLLAAGGYRTAFEILDEIEVLLRDVEQQVIALEFSIIEQRSAVENDEAPPAEAGEEEPIDQQSSAQ